MSTFIRFAFCVLLIALAPTAHAAVFRVGSDGACQFATIQAALDAAKLLPGTDGIFIARNATYTAQQLLVDGHNVDIYGGYANCSQTAIDATRTLINGTGGNQASVLTVINGATVYLEALTFAGSDAVQNSATCGAICIGSRGHVILRSVLLDNNSGGRGGGIALRSTPSEFDLGQAARLDVFDNVTISNNFAAYGGGGIFCDNSVVNLQGSNSRISSNRAGLPSNTVNLDGGGIRADNCTVDVSSSSSTGSISLNTALGEGGGVSIRGSKSTMRIFNRLPSSPVTIQNNLAEGAGGGVSIRDGAQVYGIDIVIANNTSRLGGGAVALYHQETERFTLLLMQNTLNGAPQGAVLCAASLDCNRISGNVARTLAGANLPAAAIRNSSPTAFGGIASAQLYGTRLTGNSGQSLIYAPTGDGGVWLAFYGALIDNNTVSGDLLDTNEFSDFNVVNSTISNNSLPAGVVFTSHPQLLQGSLIWQPNRSLFDSGTGPASHLIAHSVVGVTGTTNTAITNPMFVNAAVGDFRLAAGSPAIDYAPAAGVHTRDHFPRNIDLVSKVNVFGSQDVGAFEKQSDDGFNAAPVITLPSEPLICIEDVGQCPIRGYSLTDPNGNVNGKLILGVARALGGFENFWFGSVSFVETNSDPSDPWFANNVAITGPMDDISNFPLSGLGLTFFWPKPNVNGPISISMQLHDLGNTGVGGNLIATATLPVNVLPVNDVPSFTVGASQVVNANSGPRTVNPWATALSAGPPNESAQTLNFNIIGNSNPALFSVAPAVSAAGVLTYTPAANTSGSATVTLNMMDDGGTANGGINVSLATTFQITVLAGALGPALAYNPGAGAAAGGGGPVNFLGVTAVGSTGTGNVAVTPSGGAVAGTTTLTGFTFSGADAASFARTSAATLTFTAGSVAAQSVALTCTAGSTPRTANLQATETVTGGATSQRFWVLNCPGGVDELFAHGFEDFL